MTLQGGSRPTRFPGPDGLAAADRMMIIHNNKKQRRISYREQHGVDVESEFDEIVEVVGFPQLGVGRHGDASAG